MESDRAPSLALQAPARPADGPETTQGEVVVQARSRAGDPLQRVNVESFQATEAIDKAVIGPLALGYERHVPNPVRTGLRHFIRNLHEPANILNFLLQHKIGRAGGALARLAVNSTVGIAGLIDVAAGRPIGIRYYRNGFANTLGFYGVGPGPYVFLPLVGPSSARDLAGHVIDHFISPLRLLRVFHRRPPLLPITLLNTLDRRADFDGELQRQRARTDPYTERRRYYLEKRQAEIDALRGPRKQVSGPTGNADKQPANPTPQ